VPEVSSSPTLEESPVNSTESVDGVISGPDGPVLSSPHENINTNAAINDRIIPALIFLLQDKYATAIITSIVL
jgi:hypothetical protein